MAFSFVWTEFAVGAAWSWVRQLGTTSLLVYWVHIELVYGRWFGAFKESLGNIACGIAAVVVVLLMIGLSVAKSRWHSLAPAWSRFSFLNSPRRVSGD